MRRSRRRWANLRARCKRGCPERSPSCGEILRGGPGHRFKPRSCKHAAQCLRFKGMKHRLSLWTGRRDARGSKTRVGAEAHGIAAMLVVRVALVLADAVALCALLRAPRRDGSASAGVERGRVSAVGRESVPRAGPGRRSTGRPSGCEPRLTDRQLGDAMHRWRGVATSTVSNVLGCGALVPTIHRRHGREMMQIVECPPGRVGATG